MHSKSQIAKYSKSAIIGLFDNLFGLQRRLKVSKSSIRRRGYYLFLLPVIVWLLFESGYHLGMAFIDLVSTAAEYYIHISLQLTTMRRL